ncbi:DUF2169 family type VI secretion system accessory protein [Myxococcus sp. Y35]|uniref:DUF2169 family type VI secretion system accessory protein n=1 Tax=Pseudomyxococcus flavus TaxID=3115648 RepID=UPI003CEEDB65
MGQFAVDNPTPLPFEALALTDEETRPALILIAKATYTIGENGLHFADEQVPVNAAGEFWGAPGESSYRYEPEVALTKVATDVVLLGHAYAPARGTTETLVTLQVGPLKKAVRVVGERTWFRSLGRVSMTKPHPFERISLTWERAFGGWDRSHEDSKKHTFEPRNPVGVGFRASPRHFEEGLRLPNLESPEHPLREFGQSVPPAGFGFTSPHWNPRAALGGTFDEAWAKTRKPRWPRDFDRRFFNAAPSGQVASGYLRGDEPVVIANASPQGRLAFHLPGIPPPQVTAVVAGGADVQPEMRLDTVILDTDAHQVQFLWRTCLPLHNGPHDVRALAVRAEGFAAANP